MNRLKNYCKLSLLAMSLLGAGAGLMASCQSEHQSSATDPSEVVIQNIMTRTSIRAFTDQPVDEAIVEKILRAGMSAPTAVNRQPWAFVVVNEREQMERLREVHPYAQMLKTAQLAIIVCGDMERALPGASQAYWIQDASAATENILLAAHGLGLGAERPSFA